MRLKQYTGKIKTWWGSLQPKSRMTIVMMLVMTVFGLIALMGWSHSRAKIKKVVPVEKKERKDIAFEPGLLEKKRELDSQAEVQRLRKQLEAIKSGKPLDENGDPIPDNPDPFADDDIKNGVQPGSLAPKVGRINGMNMAAGGTAGAGGQAGQRGGVGRNGTTINGVPVPPVPSDGSPGSAMFVASRGGVPGVPLPPGTPGAPGTPSVPAIEKKVKGEISIVSYEGRSAKGASEKSDKKKATTTVYLPPSYMEATLLSGAYIPTTESAKGNPMPVLLRVKTPAFLPNEARAAVKGCYLIADGKANLATERAEMTLVSMSCLDRRGRAVIDQKVKGWLVDSDGVAGIGGKVVAKMGTMVARSLIAGFAGGVGDAFKAAATTTSTSALGTTQTIDPKNAAMAGIGGGLSNGFKEIQKFYLDLAKQTMPAIAVLPSKSVTAVISEGVSLGIKPINGMSGGK